VTEEGLFDSLAKVQLEFEDKLFDAVLIDFPHDIQFKNKVGKDWIKYTCQKD
jgi:hypothetical protein